ncbi:short chain dehydrogenase [Lepidopterella palustris CBS 459.81]|uniref:Short chain dehydrogenase n=1 Tax=Lepidopterella palustris CBS 459.81 TaxID=1314670 RepID=A0A8E2ECC9_9PEZI|nr:short chain dehydrogenase [Lepidopterella palustris CBS 459.81]
MQVANYFKDGTAAITGAASGIGRATACLFARDGCTRLFLGDLSMDGLEETRRIILKKHPEARVEISHVDISDEELVTNFYNQCISIFGRIDYAANVAGYVHPPGPAHTIPESEYDKCYNINLRGTFLCERAELRQMLKQEPLPGYQCRGSIVNVASMCSTSAIPNLSVYSGTKGGVLGLSTTDAIDYGPDGIRVNVIAPGNTLTPMVTREMGQDHIKHMASMSLLRRNAEPEDIANGIAWLSSPQASFITGVQLAIDGGLHLCTGPP